MTGAYEISVVIPTYQRREQVGRALSALVRQTLPADRFEVIVSIDGSDDGTREMLAQFEAPYPLRALWQPNRGRAAACNAGIMAARGAIVVLMDDDMRPAPGYLVAFARAHAAEPRLGVLGAVPIAVDADSPPVAAYVAAKFDQHLRKLARPGYRLNLRDFYSGSFAIRRAVLLEVGLFDEAFKIYGNEDLELSLRLARAGVRLVYDADALAYQSYTKTFAGLARDTLAKGQTAVLLASKHPGAYRQLKLGSRAEGSWRWRLLRGGLLAFSRVWPGAPWAIAALVERLERRRPAWAGRCYHLALDYFYWLGVGRALRERHGPRARLRDLTGAEGGGHAADSVSLH